MKKGFVWNVHDGLKFLQQTFLYFWKRTRYPRCNKNPRLVKFKSIFSTQQLYKKKGRVVFSSSDVNQWKDQPYIPIMPPFKLMKKRAQVISRWSSALVNEQHLGCLWFMEIITNIYCGGYFLKCRHWMILCLSNCLEKLHLSQVFILVQQYQQTVEEHAG